MLCGCEGRTKRAEGETVPMPELIDAPRRAQGNALEMLGFGPTECSYRVLAYSSRWRLRAYVGRGSGPVVLIIAAPIKRPYIWDLAPSASAVRYCLQHRLRLYLLEWAPYRFGHGNVGLDEYADRAIAEAVACVSHETQTKPFLMGHSLGGTFAAIFGALEPRSISGLVLLASPLCFLPGTSRFRDSIVALVPRALSGIDAVPGTLLSHISAVASPRAFIWSKLLDAAASIADPHGMNTHVRVERWSLDEVPLPGRLVAQIVDWLFRENRLCRGDLPIRRRTVGPTCIDVPTLAVVGAADEIAPLASVRPFIEAMPARDARIIEHVSETGVGLQHVGMLVGRKAYASLWPEIIAWLRARQ